MNTYEQQLDLVSRGLAIKKTDGIFDTFKYSRKVMYNYLWDKEPLTMECRGHVYDNRNGKLVQAAPRKSFNYLENGWWSDVDLSQRVIMYKKINGFMACATIHEDRLVVSTTGSTTSEYAKWAKQAILNENNYSFAFFSENDTSLFEIVLPQDPHIVDEPCGVYLLGFRMKDDGHFVPIADKHHYLQMELGDALEFVSSDRGEGYMMYKMDELGNIDTNNCCKLKTPYYVQKKKLMRQNKNNTELMYNKPEEILSNFSEDWKQVINQITKSVDKDHWLSMTDQQRRVIIEEIYG